MTVHALKPVDHIIAKAGIGLVQTVEAHYQKYQAKPNASQAKTYCTWRLRLHKHLKNDRQLLEAINEARNLGLNDTQPGPLCWDLDFEG